MSETPALARSAVDRAAYRRTDAAWLETTWPGASVLVIDEAGQAAVRDSGELVLVPGVEAPDGERLFLGEDDGTAYFAVRGPLPAEGEPKSLRECGADLDDRDAGLLVAAIGLANWHDAHLFSPRTGAPTTVREGGWVREAVDGSGQMWPRTDPAVIMLVSDGVPGPEGRALFGRQAVWPEGRYSTLAGFVEPGESAEMAVAREVAEESGVTVSDIRYVASQPWPFPGSLMLAFTALADPAQDVVVDYTELEDARWFTRAEVLSAHAAGRRVLLPMRSSIAYHLIRGWLDERPQTIAG
jgi:NAD+ diphosphatase